MSLDARRARKSIEESVRHVSPLRYPGGKSRLSGLLREIRRLNGLGAHEIVEPFAGGAGASLALLYLEEAPKIHINDADPAMFAFWWSATKRPQKFQRRLVDIPITISEWQRQRIVYGSKREVSRFDLGFSAFFLNRCNRSGIVRGGGVIGGLDQSGQWKIDARFNKVTLQKRLRRLEEFSARINVSGIDGAELIESIHLGNRFFFIDPPYVKRGQTLYQNELDLDYHARLAVLLESMPSSAWALTYDDCPEVREWYGDWANVRPFSLQYTASSRRAGKELLITPKWLLLPLEQTSRAITWEDEQPPQVIHLS